MSRIKDLQKQVFKVLTDTDEPMKAMLICMVCSLLL